MLISHHQRQYSSHSPLPMPSSCRPQRLCHFFFRANSTCSCWQGACEAKPGVVTLKTMARSKFLSAKPTRSRDMMPTSVRVMTVKGISVSSTRQLTVGSSFTAVLWGTPSKVSSRKGTSNSRSMSLHVHVGTCPALNLHQGVCKKCMHPCMDQCQVVVAATVGCSGHVWEGRWTSRSLGDAVL